MHKDLKLLNRQWFQESRFGMFIHWGLFSITGRDMWYYSTEEIEPDHYERLFDKFNPIDFDPVEWARLAKRAGMKYAVFTVKHHEGFCLWDTQQTDFKVTRTACGKDVLRLWLDAFRSEGLKVGIYFSLIDWHHPHYTIDYKHPLRRHAEQLNQTRDFSIYRDFMHAQIRELMTQYGKIDIFWPDFSYAEKEGHRGKQAADWDSTTLKSMIESLQPGILINNRLGIPGEMECDFITPEQYIPNKDVTKHREDEDTASMWEACETISSSWGYCRGDLDLKTTQQIIKSLVTCVGNNGNLLLNVGPTPRGRIQPEFTERLSQVGEWLQTYGESIYGASSCEYKVMRQNCPILQPGFTRKGNHVYVHFFDKYPPFNVILKDMGGKVKYVEFVSDQTEIEFEEIELEGVNLGARSLHHILLKMPAIQPDPYNTVVRIVMKESAIQKE